MESNSRQRRVAFAVASTLMLSALWALTHIYHGFARDGELYAVQAMARVQPWLRADLYLQNTSQDQFTVFSPIYAVLIRLWGLQTAELTLFCICTVLFLVAAWVLVARLSSARDAVFSVALLMVSVGYYGAYKVFNYSENYLSARSMGEALIVCGFAAHFSGYRRAALSIASIALFVHPLMALPGVLLLVCLWLPGRIAALVAAVGLLATLTLALLSVWLHASTGFAAVIDPAWLEVVRERSQYLFPKYWSVQDWEITARPFACLTLSFLVLPDVETRRLCFAAMLVGACGLLIATVGATIGPVAILLQGQAWRWMWVTTFVCVALVIPTAVHMWRDERCGSLCAALLVLGWACSVVDDTVCVGAALLAWLLRPKISATLAIYLKWATAAICMLVLIWMIASSWSFARGPIPESGREPAVLGHLREIFALGVPGMLLAWGFWFSVHRLRSDWAMVVTCGVCLGCVAWILPGSVKAVDPVGTAAEINAFADWRAAIPPTSNVLMVPTRKSAAWNWFTLERPSYLSVAQSAGVVFSADTAQEVRRRSEVLLPLEEQDWRILDAFEVPKVAPGGVSKPSDRPLTASILVRLCQDPVLDFVIAKEDVGFAPLRHTHAGTYRNWNLYDCRKVRSTVPAT